VGVNHGGFDIFVTEEFLNGTDVVAVLEQVGGEGVAEGVATAMFRDFGTADGISNGFLDHVFK
jgi:hypothetical protein